MFRYKLDYDKIIQIIQADSIEEFKALNLPSSNINLPLFHQVPLVAKHNDTFLKRYCPDNISILSYSILCEAVEIMKYINENFYPLYDKLFQGQAPIHFLAMVNNREIIESAFSTESCQRSLNVQCDVKLYDKTLQSFPIQIAISHHNVTMVYFMLSPYFEIKRLVPQSNNNPTGEPEKVDIFQRSFSQHSPLMIAVLSHNITMALLLISFLNIILSRVGSDDQAIVEEFCLKSDLSDQITSRRKAALKEIINSRSFIDPSEIFTNYLKDPSYYEIRYNVFPMSGSSTQKSLIGIATGIAYACENPKCSSTTLEKCHQCQKFYCSTCMVKGFHLCQNRL